MDPKKLLESGHVHFLIGRNGLLGTRWNMSSQRVEARKRSFKSWFLSLVGALGGDKNLPVLDSSDIFIPVKQSSVTLRDKKTFQEDLKTRRCLIPSDGFYKWKAESDKKVPYRIMRKDGRLFALAGLRQEELTHSGQTRRFAIITTSANEPMQPIHARMPVILTDEDELTWLEADGPDVQGLLKVLEKPISSETMEAFPVSANVNAPKNDFPELIRRE